MVKVKEDGIEKRMKATIKEQGSATTHKKKEGMTRAASAWGRGGGGRVEA